MAESPKKDMKNLSLLPSPRSLEAADLHPGRRALSAPFASERGRRGGHGHLSGDKKEVDNHVGPADGGCFAKGETPRRRVGSAFSLSLSLFLSLSLYLSLPLSTSL